MARRPAQNQKAQGSRRPASRGATSRKRQTKSSRAGLPAWLWGVVGLIAGFVLAQYFQQTAPSPVATIVPKPSRSAAPSDGTSRKGASDDATGQAASGASEPRMPTFEFYTLLPESEVIAPKVDRTTAPPSSSGEDAAASDDKRADDVVADPSADGLKYMLQAASFRNVADAKRLASRLQDLGLIAKITTVQTASDEIWHRVQVGPYQDTHELTRAQDLMVTQGIEPLLIKLQD
ncbi:sporulation related protein [Chromohalobacter marismortui]|uniref:Sporulation related protein n=1 Tax=Chromohalobacter marismortui TaxID=42055 RepID=A0A4R7NSJ5_9GAMM|nr:MULTISPECIES: SPOR domain-containing protein [Chromohalobacter]MCI0509094.1 SPOR domain-containing protein [Chromohalobacter sp.]MCI0592761.1 SPOR domain-containing protein [Chromohalobacter sp.]TDU24014.1 sporulation related protein [Chromohalobacter marismortui]